ncbi:hypothetical protein SVIOM342S_07562 [Streptomyces violaceorubidus]
MPPVARASPTAAALSTRGSWRSATPPTFSVVMPAETRPTTFPPGSSMGTMAWTSGPMVPSISSVTVFPASAGAMFPTNFFPMRSGLGWV